MILFVKHVKIGKEVLVHLLCFLLVRLVLFSEFVAVALLDECETVELDRFSVLVYRYLDARIDGVNLVLYEVLLYLCWRWSLDFFDYLPIVSHIEENLRLMQDIPRAVRGDCLDVRLVMS